MTSRLHLLHPSQTHLDVTYEFDPLIDVTLMRDVVAALVGAMKRDHEIHVVVELGGFPNVSLDAIAEKTRHIADLMTLRGRYAIVTDASWMATMVPLVTLLSPLEVRLFSRGRLAEARVWARTPTVTPEAMRSAG